MTPPPPLFHSFLRPAVLQILRATGYHGAKISVIDSVTDLAARYLLHLCQLTALFAAHNNDEPPPLLYPDGSSAASVNPVVPAPTIVDVRMALQRAGALLPERCVQEQEYLGGEEDMRGVEAFIAWATGPLNREIARIALDGNDEARDYLDALKKKHSKNDDDSKFLGTLLGRSIEHGDVLVEGGECPSISMWEERRRLASQKPPEAQGQTKASGAHGVGDGDGEEDSRPPSSGLSSLGDRSVADEMDLS
ncbi:7e5e1587-4992-40a8-85cf-e9ae921c28fd [Thermothielavioides terrestris]|uniref:Bromodomain associated domain-containing protein n=2 Tax=Thermothielavioides terrestris TaxID=2587410 RepID=G2R2Y5_THETT|nr:uncharacterized protein THITE_35130 [Thermothielavioides terrestris NRRL 8126]AEO65901.1 hypothetical protein THITE_35130 [Thermothielavioides terrestris NRRL 8126]SPQ18831.1 7e5e1587-4992-40a8-85cf-e9ae921c28fd [Thermothielavioides terrestris]